MKDDLSNARLLTRAALSVHDLFGRRAPVIAGNRLSALLRLEQRNWIVATWGTSENNRKVRFYTITKAGRRRM